MKLKGFFEKWELIATMDVREGTEMVRYELVALPDKDTPEWYIITVERTAGEAELYDIESDWSMILESWKEIVQ